jgi:prepilin-type N-terminal cleavage/methylation domain-containing protein
MHMVRGRNSLTGFTLMEMIVSLAIITIITVVAINGQNDFNRTLVVTDTAYTIALSLRQAQTFGLSSRTTVVGGSTFTNAGFGIRFDTLTPTAYTLFTDVSKANYATPPAWCPTGTAGQPDEKPGNCRFDPSGSEIVQSYSFNRGFTVDRFCGRKTSDNVLHCSDDGSLPLTGIDIVFIRPNTNSIITATDASNVYQLNDAHIRIAAPTGGTRYICVTRVGQISVTATTCP